MNVFHLGWLTGRTIPKVRILQKNLEKNIFLKKLFRDILEI